MKCRNCKYNDFLVDDNGEQYNWCDIVCDNLDIDEERDCAAYAPATNADRIRAMTDEELAEFFQNITFCDSCFIYKNECGTERYSCEQRWLDWLREEADNGN